ncbi:hypothetical protein POL58_47400 [Nannocystis sp. ncelm1]|uniref:Protein kinase domain-containing protein n=1 Tax=Nannocystis radixulma TaxID=2995305 RepID=A0ABT5BMY9_9BACT|nr:hypothetical protein [Nannocystis radixulma]MDC0675462.1 hypothetical protein [Nannocystis radixulma]
MSNEDQNTGNRPRAGMTGITPTSTSQYEGYQGTELPPGTVVTGTSQFEIVQRLGEGGMSKVYKAFDQPDEPLHRPEGDEERRARVGASPLPPRGPHVRELHAPQPRARQPGRYGEEFDVLWFAMEYLRGKDVSWFIESGTPMGIPVILEIFSQVLDALRYVPPAADRPLRHQAVERVRHPRLARPAAARGQAARLRGGPRPVRPVVAQHAPHHGRPALHRPRADDPR